MKLTDEDIITKFYMHTVMDDEPLFAFDRKSALALARELLAAAPVADAADTADEVTRLRRALYQIAHWPDGRTDYGQAKIKRFAIGILDGDPPPVADAAVAPSGWRMRRDDDGAIVVQKDGVGGAVVTRQDEEIAGVILHALVGDILDAAPSPAAAADAVAPKLTAPEGEDPMRYGDRKLEDSVKRLRAAYCVQQPLPIPDQMALVWRFDIGRLYHDWLRLDAWQKEIVSKRDEAAAQPDERAAFEAWKSTANLLGETVAGAAWAGWQARAAYQATVKGDKFSALLAKVPRKPNAITYERGWELLDELQRLSDSRSAAPPADPCPQCIPGGVCKTLTCGRLAALNNVPAVGVCDSEPVAMPRPFGRWIDYDTGPLETGEGHQ